MSAVSDYPHPVSGKVGEDIRLQMNEANQRFGVKDGTLVRMALAAYLPTYLAAAGRTEHFELFGKISAALDQRPDLKAEIERLLRAGVRQRPSARAVA